MSEDQNLASYARLGQPGAAVPTWLLHERRLSGRQG